MTTPTQLVRKIAPRDIRKYLRALAPQMVHRPRWRSSNEDPLSPAPVAQWFFVIEQTPLSREIPRVHR